MGWILGSPCSSMVAICKFNLLSRNLSTSSLVIPGISEVALTIFIILQWHTNRKKFLHIILLPHKLFTHCFRKCKFYPRYVLMYCNCNNYTFTPLHTFKLHS